MDDLLKLMQKDSSLKRADLAALLNRTEEEVATQIKEYEDEKIILGYRAILNEERLELNRVRAVIEVKITPERQGGFDRIARRISRYEEVRSCYLMSGAYDLLVIVEGAGLHEVATFVSEKLATLEGVISTATHFLLKPYKEHGIPMHGEERSDRLPVTP